MEQFAWVDMVFNFVRVDWDGKHLRVNPFQSSERELVPVGGMLFKATNRTVTSHVLFESSAGVRVISDGLRSYAQVSLGKMLPHWLSLVAGLLGFIWILLTGLGRALTGGLKRSAVLLVPFVAVCALLLPVPFFYLQPFLQMGDLTVASGLLAVVTGVLPVAMMFGIVVYFRRGQQGVLCLFDVIACFAVLQWAVLLMAVNQLPLRLWV